MVKNPLSSAGDVRDSGSVPGSGRCPGGVHGILAWRIPASHRGGWWVTVHGDDRSDEACMHV